MGDLVRPVHLGLDDVNGAGAAVAELVPAFQIVHGDQRRHGGVEHALRDFAALLVQHGVGVHVMADVAHQHEAAPMQAQFAAVRGRVDPVGVEAALDRAAALREARAQRAIHQAEPVAVDLDLVVGVHRRDRVLQVHDGGDCRLDHQIGDAGRIVLPDPVLAVNLDFDV